MTDLFAAIVTRYGAVALSSSLTGGLWNTEAPQETECPYGVFQLISDVPDWTFEEDFENILFQFNLFSDTSDPVEICILFELLKTAFDFFDLIIDNHEIVSLVRENSILTRIENIWQYNVTYRIVFQKN